MSTGSDPSFNPVWEIATLFPNQGQWSEEEYLALGTNRLVEFDRGTVEVLAVPTDRHQAIVAFLYLALRAFTAGKGHIVRFAALRLRLWEGKYREPDLMVLLAQNADLRGERFWVGADLTIEVVSDSLEDRQRDLVTKRAEYARAGIAEYWIVDPEAGSISVLRLAGDRYSEHGVFGRGERATSVILDGFAVAVDAVLAAD